MFITYRQRQGTAQPRIKYIGVDEYFLGGKTPILYMYIT